VLVFAVRLGSYEAAEIDSLWWSAEDAQARSDSLEGWGWNVEAMPVHGVPPVAVGRGRGVRIEE